MNIEIGSYEAKTRLPELLRDIQAGSRYTITLRGKPVADLVPVGSDSRDDALAAVEHMQALMRAAVPNQGMNIKALIAEGRA